MPTYVLQGCEKCGGALGPVDEEGDRLCINCGAYTLATQPLPYVHGSRQARAPRGRALAH